MSSDRTGAVGKAAATAGSGNGASAAGGTPAEDRDAAAEALRPDPWFAPGPKIAADGPGQPDPADFDVADADVADADVADADVADADPADLDPADLDPADAHPADADRAAARPGEGEAAADAASARPGAAQAEWFLPTGRAGLLPDSVTVSWDEERDGHRPDHDGRPEAAGAPPWAGEAVATAVSAPPPWETGPWPGPGEDAPSTAATPGQGSNGRSAAGGPSAGRPVAGQGALPAGGRWTARTVLVAGLVPLVLPGLVLGVLGLRQAGSGSPVRKASWLAIGASIAWALIIILGASSWGGSAARCTGYPAAVGQAYARVMTDLSSHAPASVLASDLGVAASRANASAAAAGQISIRTALFTMADDMAQARADVVAHRGVPATLRQHLTDDGTAPTGSCAS